MSGSLFAPTGVPRKVLSRSGVGTTTHVVQASRLTALRVHSPQPLVILVLRGRKLLTAPGPEQVAVAGDVVALPAGSTVDLVNEPGRDGPYEAVSVIYDEALPATLVPAADLTPLARPTVLKAIRAEFGEAIHRARAALVNPETVPERIARHRLVEVLGWMADLGLTFPPPRTASTGDRLRALVAADPGTAWSTDRAAAALAISEATLRRRLANEGETLTSLIQDVRMTHAMLLLQATDDPILHVALACGFGHPSSFARLFKARFGTSPRQVRRAND